MNWLKRAIRNWLHSNQSVEVAGHSPQSPLMFALGEAGERHYVTVPVQNGFALITRVPEDIYAPAKPNDPRASVTFCASAEDLSNTLIAKMAHHKLTAR